MFSVPNLDLISFLNVSEEITCLAGYGSAVKEIQNKIVFWPLLSHKTSLRVFFFCLFLYFFCVCVLFRAAPEAYRSSQARGRIGAAAADLHHSHRNAGSEQSL